MLREPGKYHVLSDLSFENRRSSDRQAGLIRPTVPLDSFEFAEIEDRSKKSGPFFFDLDIIAGSFFYRKLGKKLQLIPSFASLYQNRLFHSDDVANIAEKICNKMGLSRNSTDLTQAIAYAHDIGHAPFSHSAEEVYNKKLNKYGIKWDHDFFALEILTKFAPGWQTFYGMPITIATLEGLVKRYKRYFDEEERKAKNITLSHFNRIISEIEANKVIIANKDNLHLNKWNCVEGQIASVADWISFTVTDIIDLLHEKLQNNLPSEVSVFFDTISQAFLLVAKTGDRIKKTIKQFAKDRKIIIQNYPARMYTMIRMLSNELESSLIDDLLENTMKNFLEERKKGNIEYADDIRNLDNLLISFSPEVQHGLLELGRYFKNDIFPTVDDTYLTIIERFFDLVYLSFRAEFNRKNGLSFNKIKIKIEQSWMQEFVKIEREEKDQKTKEGKLLYLTAEYITVCYQDLKVLDILEQIDRKFYDRYIVNRISYLNVPLPLTDERINFFDYIKEISSRKASEALKRFSNHNDDKFIV